MASAAAARSDKIFPGGFSGLNILQILRLSPIAAAAHMGMVMNGLTEELNFNGEHHGLFFTGSTTASNAPIFNSPTYLQPAPSITSANCTQLQIWSTAAAQNFINGSWSLPLSCSLIYRKVVVFQELLYRFVVAFVKACGAADLGWAAGMLTTLDTLRDIESVRERPRAIVTSLDAFLHGRIGDLFLSFRTHVILSSITKFVMGLSDFGKLSALFASTFDATKPLYQQMSMWHQLFHQLRGSLVSPTPGTHHPAVGLGVEFQ